MPADRGTESLVRKVLRNPDIFPDEFKAWLPRYMEGNPNLRIAEAQLPITSAIAYVGVSASAAFSNSWTNYGAGYETAGYYKDSFGIVHLSGLIQSGTLNAAAFTLPTGYRPKARLIFPAIANAGAGDVLGRCDVLATGDVIPVSGGNTFFSLNGITFRAFS